MNYLCSKAALLAFQARAIEKKKKAAQDDAMAILEQLEQAEQDGNVLGLDENLSRGQNGDADDATTSGRISFGAVKQAKAPVGRREAPADTDDLSDDGDGEELEEELTGKSGNARGISNKSLTPGKVNFSRTDHAFENGKGEEPQNHLQADSQDMDDEIPQNGRMSYSGVVTVPAKKMEISIAGAQKRRPAGNGLLSEAPSHTQKTHDAVKQSTFSDDDSDGDNPQVDLLDASGSQQDLIRQAFAGDDVEAEFEKVKSQVLDEEVPLGEGPVSLPGWGQWTHVQKIRGQPAWLRKEQELVKSKRENALSNRKDARLKHVIISEKMDKKVCGTSF